MFYSLALICITPKSDMFYSLALICITPKSDIFYSLALICITPKSDMFYSLALICITPKSDMFYSLALICITPKSDMFYSLALICITLCIPMKALEWNGWVPRTEGWRALFCLTERGCSRFRTVAALSARALSSASFALIRSRPLIGSQCKHSAWEKRPA